MAHLGPLAKGLSQGSKVWVGCSHLKPYLGRDPLASSLVWLLARFSSSWVAGLRTLLPPWLLARGPPPPQFPATGISPYDSSQHRSLFPSKQAGKKSIRVCMPASRGHLNWQITSYHFCPPLFTRSQSLGAATLRGGEYTRT